MSMNNSQLARLDDETGSQMQHHNLQVVDNEFTVGEQNIDRAG